MRTLLNEAGKWVTWHVKCSYVMFICWNFPLVLLFGQSFYLCVRNLTGRLCDRAHSCSNEDEPMKLPWNTLSASDDACTKFIAIKMLFISHFFSHIFLNLRMKKRKWNCLKLDPPWPVAVCIMGAALWHYLTLIASHRSASALDTYQRVGGRAKLNSRWHGTSRSLRRGADAESAQSSWWSPAERVCMCDTEASWLHVHTVSVEAAEHRILKTDLIVL